MRPQPNATAIGAAPFAGIFVAATVAMCASAIGRVLLQVIVDVLAKRDSSVPAVSWILGGISVRFFVAHGFAAEAFMMAYPRLPTVRQQLQGPRGALVVGAALGTLMWIALRALFPITGPAPAGVTLASWLTFALISGPVVVWSVRPYLATDGTSDALREGRREIRTGLTAILPALLVLLWAFTTSGLGIGIVFVGFPALVVAVVGASAILGGLSKARGRPSQRWARATPYLIFVAVIALALILSR